VLIGASLISINIITITVLRLQHLTKITSLQTKSGTQSLISNSEKNHTGNNWHR